MTAIIVHRRSSIQCFFSDTLSPVAATFPADVLADGEIRNEDAYLRIITAMMGKNSGASVSAVLVLADDLCYIAKATPEEEASKTTELISTTPFTRVEAVPIRTAKETYIVATNVDLYEAAIRAFAAAGVSITLVIPWGALTYLKLSTAGEMDKLTAKRTSDSLSQLRLYSFPVDAHEHAVRAPGEHGNEVKHASLPVGWIVFGALALIYAAGMIFYMLRQ